MSNASWGDLPAIKVFRVNQKALMGVCMGIASSFASVYAVLQSSLNVEEKKTRELHEEGARR
jgi:hypothetical protein